VEKKLEMIITFVMDLGYEDVLNC